MTLVKLLIVLVIAVLTYLGLEWLAWRMDIRGGEPDDGRRC